MDKIRRHALKSDRFVETVGHEIEYVKAHRQEVMRWLTAGAVVIVLVGGFFLIRSRNHATRQMDLAKALRLKDAVIGVSPTPGDPRQFFLTQPEKDKAIRQALEDIAKNHSGSDEGAVANYQLGTIDSDAGSLAEAEKHFQAAVDSGSKLYASVAKLSLSQVYAAQGKNSEAEKMLKELQDNPTVMVSKEQATMALARLIMLTRPADARKMIEPFLTDQRQAVARSAQGLVAEIPNK